MSECFYKKNSVCIYLALELCFLSLLFGASLDYLARLAVHLGFGVVQVIKQQGRFGNFFLQLELELFDLLVLNLHELAQIINRVLLLMVGVNTALEGKGGGRSDKK